MPLVLLQRSRTHSMNVCEKRKRFVNFFPCCAKRTCTDSGWLIFRAAHSTFF